MYIVYPASCIRHLIFRLSRGRPTILLVAMLNGQACPEFYRRDSLPNQIDKVMEDT